MSQGPAINRTIVQGVVSDGLPDGGIDGAVQPLSITQQGGLRVAMISDDFLMTFFVPTYEHLWGNSPSFSLGNSPWDAY